MPVILLLRVDWNACYFAAAVCDWSAKFIFLMRMVGNKNTLPTLHKSKRVLCLSILSIVINCVLSNPRKINLERKKTRKINLERKKTRKINLERKKTRKITRFENLKSAIYGDAKYN